MTTSQPTSSSELQLYRVLQRANLLQYYDTFISQGGDDVQQLCEAGEEEFLEIMALVGMASKPLHVRRLQKALQEWVTNPTVFNQALANSPATSGSPGSLSPAVKTSQTFSDSAQPPLPLNIVTATSTWKPKSTDLLLVPSPVNREDEMKSREDRKSPGPPPVLVEDQIALIALSAEQLVPTLEQYEPKPMNMKKEINREIDFVIKLPFDAENRMELVRKYSAIYGRFDSKRKGEKPMSMHEISVNEAAAQICKHIPALMTRRDELFPLARQVVRDSGYQYSKGHSRAQSETPNVKRMKLDLASNDSNGSDFDKTKAEDILKDISNGLQQIADTQEQIKLKIEEAKEHEEYEVIHELQASLEELASQQLKLLTQQAEIKRREKQCHKKSLEFNGLNGLDDNDSANYSNASSPVVADEKQPDILNVPVQKDVQESRQFVQETLFDEGLRIAAQYGMADFAEAVTELKPKFVGVDKTETGAIDYKAETGAIDYKAETGAIDYKAETGAIDYNTNEESASERSADESSLVVNGSDHTVS